MGRVLRRGLPGLIVLLALCAEAPGSSAQQPNLTPARVHLFADDASVVNGLLRTEDSLTRDAVALRPGRRALALRIRVHNRVLFSLCNAIIRDNKEISRAERGLRQAHAEHADSDASPRQLLNEINRATADVRSQLEAMTQKGDEISVTDMFEMQMLMNHFSQLSEMAASVTSADNSAINSMVTNFRG